MQDVPGVSVEQQKTGGNSISMRGLGSAYTLILIDGKRQNVTPGFSTNGFGESLNAMMPPPSMIERIEVIRGPASIIYGSDAMGGVINIITKKNHDKVASSVQLETRLPEDTKTFGNTYGVNGYIATPLVKNKLSMNLRAGYRYGDNNRFYKPEGLTGCTTGRPPNVIQVDCYRNPYATHSSTGFMQWNAGTRFNYTPNANNSLYLDAEVYFSRGGSLNTSGNQITGIRDFYKINSVLNYDADYDWGKVNTYVQYSQTMFAGHLGTNIGDNKGASVDWVHPSINRDVVFQATYNNNFDLNRFGAIVFNGGVYYLYENLYRKPTSGSNTDLTMNQFALFGEGQYVINDYISTTLGVRFNYSDIFKAIPNPRFFVNVNPTNWLTFKAGVSSGVLVPNLSYLYDGWTMNTTSAGGTLGNKNLRPETSWNYELSAIMDFKPAMFILTGYYTDFNNRIQSVPYFDDECTDTTGLCTTYRNIDKSLITGAEASLKVKPIYGFSLDASYSFTYTEILSAGSEYMRVNGALVYLEDQYKGEPLSLIPRHSFTIKPAYRYRNFDMYVRWQGKFQTPTPTPASNNTTAGNNLVRGAIGKYYKDYQIVDIAASYKFFDRFTATFAINNLFNVNFWDPVLFTNTNYTNQYQRILPSRNYWLTLRADF